jgi:outer membrane lipoprotein-sorting protein
MLRKMAALAVLAFLAAPAQAQDLTLDEVLNNYYEAIGGLDAWEAVQSIKMTGKMMMGGMGIEAPFTVMAKRPNKARVEFEFQGMAGIQAYDGETAWQVMPFMGNPDPEEVPEDDAEDLYETADLDGPLVGWQESGYTVELLGMEETEGTPAYKLKVTLKNGNVQYYYLDAEYFIPIRMEGVREAQGRTVEYESIFSDYKEVDGLMIAHSIEARPKGAPAGQVVTIDLIELNVDLPDSLFVMPEKSGEGQQ